MVTATVDDETRTLDATEHVVGDGDCVGVRLSLLTTGGVDYRAKSMRECSSPEPRTGDSIPLAGPSDD